MLALVPGLELSVSVTTRPPRPSERDGVDYRFVTDAEFDAMIERGDLLEWAEIFGHRSGTPTAPIEQLLDEGRDVVLEIDVQGAEWVRRRRSDAVLIFLEPPSLGELERRLRSRGTEDEEKLARRLAKAGHEIGQKDRFDHVVVNDDVERASQQVAAIIQGSRTALERPSASNAGGHEPTPTARPAPRPEPRKDPA